MAKTRLAFVGVGDMGTGHLCGFDQIEECEIVWIADPHEKNVDRAMKYVRRNNPRICRDYRALLEHDDYDAVVVSVPNYMHKDATIPFLEKGKHVLLEKPVASCKEDCDAILLAAEKANRVLQIGLVYRYSNLYNRMAKEVKSGRVGNVTLMWCKEFRDPFPPADWFYEQDKSGGTLVEKDCHHFDIFNWMIGAKAKRVFASGGQHVIRYGKDCLITNSYTHYDPKNISHSTVIDHAWVTVDYENGSKANLGLCMYLKPKNLMSDGIEIGLIGDNGGQMLAKDDKTLEIFGGENFTKELINVDTLTDKVNDGHIGSQKQRYAFLESIRTGKAPFVSGEVGKEALLIALAAEKSIREERYVYIDEL
ncbi:MAG TPA: Gfo/Idh/MocA family oxidoreductase [Bacilli bacterium]